MQIHDWRISHSIAQEMTKIVIHRKDKRIQKFFDTTLDYPGFALFDNLLCISTSPITPKIDIHTPDRGDMLCESIKRELI